MEAIAQMVADFHATIPVADNSMSYASKDAIYQSVKENFELMAENYCTGAYHRQLDSLQRWSAQEFKKLESVFEQRKQDGFIRECHGDMHLRNLVWLDNKPAAFDCIEFNASLRWIDVMSEIAFLVMDLQDHQQEQLAQHFLNSYLEKTGDYAGLLVLPFYLSYRAMVRAKVAALQIEQKGSDKKARGQLFLEFESYLKLTSSYTEVTVPKLIIMRGLSASGKSTVSQKVLDSLGAIRIRSDIERKRLFDPTTNEQASTVINAGIYTEEASQQTYSILAKLSTGIIDAGFSVIVDATFLKYEQREVFQKIARCKKVPYIILEVTASIEALRQRIVVRKNDVSDADTAVLEHQLSNWQPLHTNETCAAIAVNTEEVLDIDALVDVIRKKTCDEVPQD